MEVLHERCAGLDVHKNTVVACLRVKESANVVEAARRLGINCSTLWRKRKRYNL